MNDFLNTANLTTWCVQMVALVAVASILAFALRLRVPSARLLFWQMVLAACFLLPFIRTWKRETILILPLENIRAVPIPKLPPLHTFTFDTASVAMSAIALGCLARLIWLVIGLVRLRMWLRRSSPLDPPSSWGAEADLRISADITSPVTFGFRVPVVLLPEQFPDMPEARRDLILCHEIMHVRRWDWLFMLGEELIRCALWFHPAIWWVLGQIQLAREEAVDADVIAMTRARNEYVDTLLAIAGAASQPDLAPAPLFLRRRHLKQRLFSILEEVHMSKTKAFSALATSLVLLAASCWFVTGAIPLYGAPQLAADSPGVSVETNGANLIHRSPVSVPATTLVKGLEGAVTVQVKLDSNGNVADANVVSGPDELRKPVLQSVLNWHFTKDAAGSTRQIVVSFAKAPQAAAAAAPALENRRVAAAPGAATPLATKPATPKAAIQISDVIATGVSDSVKAEVLDLLGIHAGDNYDPTILATAEQRVRGYDEHLIVVRRTNPSQQGLTIEVMAPQERPTLLAPPPPPPLSVAAQPASAASLAGYQRIGGRVMQTALISQTKPVYPPLAKEAHVQGTVTMQIKIGQDGHVQDVELISGPPLLVQAAVAAVRDWIYKPIMLNGNPVPVITTTDVNFTLAQ